MKKAKKNGDLSLERLRQAAARREVFSLAAVARMAGCSRWTIYHLHRCPEARKKIETIFGL